MTAPKENSSVHGFHHSADESSDATNTADKLFERLVGSIRKPVPPASKESNDNPTPEPSPATLAYIASGEALEETLNNWGDPEADIIERYEKAVARLDEVKNLQAEFESNLDDELEVLVKRAREINPLPTKPTRRSVADAMRKRPQG